METFTVKSASSRFKIEKPHFWALCKGLNSGKPLTQFCPNSFRIETENEALKDTIYWVTYLLWKTKAFHPYLTGSVIPFIRIQEFKQIIIEKLRISESEPSSLPELIKKLQFIEEKERMLKDNLNLIQELKKALIYKSFVSKS